MIETSKKLLLERIKSDHRAGLAELKNALEIRKAKQLGDLQARLRKKRLTIPTESQEVRKKVQSFFIARHLLSLAYVQTL